MSFFVSFSFLWPVLESHCKNEYFLAPYLLEGEDLEEVEAYIYLGSVIDLIGGTNAEVKS